MPNDRELKPVEQTNVIPEIPAVEADAGAANQSFYAKLYRSAKQHAERDGAATGKEPSKEGTRAGSKEASSKGDVADSETGAAWDGALKVFAMDLDASAGAIHDVLTGKDPRGSDASIVQQVIESCEARSPLKYIDWDVAARGVRGSEILDGLSAVLGAASRFRKAIQAANTKFGSTLAANWLNQLDRIRAAANFDENQIAEGAPITKPAVGVRKDGAIECIEGAIANAQHLRMLLDGPQTEFEARKNRFSACLTVLETIVDNQAVPGLGPKCKILESEVNRLLADPAAKAEHKLPQVLERTKDIIEKAQGKR